MHNELFRKVTFFFGSQPHRQFYFVQGLTASTMEKMETAGKYFLAAMKLSLPVSWLCTELRFWRSHSAIFTIVE